MLTFWVSILALSILLYGLRNQFVLGVRVLLLFARDEGRGRALLSTVTPIWGGNETWFIVAGIVLCVASPVVCAALLSAFYVPFLLMLAGLILRGVAVECCDNSQRLRGFWYAAFSGGSLVAAFTQRLMLGALIEGRIMLHGEYSGDDFAWWSLLAVLCGGGGVCVGYFNFWGFWFGRKRGGGVWSLCF